MMQSLLADGFKLVVHSETWQVPVFALVLAKPGVIGVSTQAASGGPKLLNRGSGCPGPRPNMHHS